MEALCRPGPTSLHNPSKSFHIVPPAACTFLRRTAVLVLGKEPYSGGADEHRNQSAQRPP